MPPQYVQPYVKRGKNDAANAEALCKAIARLPMRFVPMGYLSPTDFEKQANIATLVSTGPAAAQ